MPRMSKKRRLEMSLFTTARAGLNLISVVRLAPMIASKAIKRLLSLARNTRHAPKNKKFQKKSFYPLTKVPPKEFRCQ